MTTARIYVRVSTTKQSDGASLETQLTACRRYATEHDLIVAGEYTDILSGTRDDRPHYQRLLDDLHPGEVVLAWRVDRLGRRKSEMFRFFEECKRRGIALVAVTQPEMSNELARDLLSVLAAFESQQIAERVKPNMITRASNGRWMARAPLGYRLPKPHEPDYADGHLVPSDDAPLVRDIYAHYLANGNYVSASLRFNLRPNYIKAILNSSTYIGVTTWDGLVVPGTHPPLVDRATWEATQARILTRRKAGRRYHEGSAMLTGLIYAEDTDMRMHHIVHRLRKKTMPRYYACNTVPSLGVRVTCRAEIAERIVLDDLRALALAPAARRAYERDLRRVAHSDPHRRAREALTRDRDRLQEAMNRAGIAYSRGLINETALTAVHRDQARERARIEAEGRTLPPAPDLAQVTPLLNLRVGLTARVDDLEARGDVPGLRRLIEALFRRIEVWDARADGTIGWTRRKTALEHPPRIVSVSIFAD